MDCTECGGEIRQGEEHVTVARNIEVEERGRFWERMFGLTVVVAVKDSRTVATYHRHCEPGTGTMPSKSTAIQVKA